MEIHNYKDTCDELKHCPFCGTTQETGVVRKSTEWACETAIKKWNRRIYEKTENNK